MDMPFMQNKEPKKDYLEVAALDCGNDIQLWYRYLQKYVTFEENKISKDLFKRLMISPNLSKEQKRILKRVMNNSSGEHIYVCCMSEQRHGGPIRNFALDEADVTIKDDVFTMLNQKLAEKGLDLTIVCAGGFVLQTLGIRTTMDVDAFYSTSKEIEQLVEDVGDAFDINEDDELWLNNDIANMNPVPKKQYWQPYKKYSNLTIYTVSPEYLIGMKLKTGREKDKTDVAAIIQKLGLTDPVALYKKLRSMKFAVDFGDIMFAFGEALGTKWWQEWAKKNWKIIAAME